MDFYFPLIIYWFFSFSCSYDIRIIHTNDIHSQTYGTGPDIDYEVATGGFSRISYLVKNLQSENPSSTLTLDAGDFFGGSMFQLMSASYIFDLSAEFEMFEILKYDAITIGNHELDGSILFLEKIMKKANNCSIPVVISNAEFENVLKPSWNDYKATTSPPRCSSEEDNNKTSNFPFFCPFVLKELKSGEETLNVAIIGLLGPNAMRITSKKHRSGIRVAGFSDESGETIDEYAAHIHELTNFIRKKHNIDLVISISHSGEPEDRLMLTKIHELEMNKKRLIDVHISGHTHENYCYIHKKSGTIVAQTSGYGMEVGVLDISFNRLTGEIVLNNNGSHYKIVDNNIPDDLIVKNKLDGYVKLLNSVFFSMKEVESRYYFPIGIVSSFDDQSDFLDWCAECMREEINRILKEKGERKVDMLIFSHEYGRILKDHAIKYDNGTAILFSDIFRWFGVGSHDEDVTMSNWKGEDYVFWYMKKKDVENTVVTWQLMKEYVDYLNISLAGISFEKNRFGIPFVRNRKLGYVHSVKSDGVLLAEMKYKYVKVAAKRVLFDYIREIPVALTHGFVDIQTFDKFGRTITRPIHSGFTETEVFSGCLKNRN